MKTCLGVMCILVDNKSAAAPKVQQVLTKYNVHFISRNGLSIDENKGLITVVIKNNSEIVAEIIKELQQISGVSVRDIDFNFC